MKRELFWVKSCLGKKVYQTEDYALAVCQKMNKKFEKKSRPYYCSQCCKFHLTTKPLIKKEEIPKRMEPTVIKEVAEWHDVLYKKPPEDTKIYVRDYGFKIYKAVFKGGIFIKNRTQEEIKGVWLWSKKDIK